MPGISGFSPGMRCRPRNRGDDTDPGIGVGPIKGGHQQDGHAGRTVITLTDALRRQHTGRGQIGRSMGKQEAVAGDVARKTLVEEAETLQGASLHVDALKQLDEALATFPETLTDAILLYERAEILMKMAGSTMRLFEQGRDEGWLVQAIENFVRASRDFFSAIGPGYSEDAGRNYTLARFATAETLAMRGELFGNVQHFEEAASMYESLLGQEDVKHSGALLGAAQLGLGKTQTILATRREGGFGANEATFKAAISSIESATDTFDRAGLTLDLGRALASLGHTFSRRANHFERPETDRLGDVRLALKALRPTVEKLTEASAEDSEVADARLAYGAARSQLGALTKDMEEMAAGISEMEEAEKLGSAEASHLLEGARDLKRRLMLGRG